MERMKAIFVAGGLTGLVLVTILVLGFRNEGAAVDATSGLTMPVEVLGVSDGAAPAIDAAGVQTLLDQNAQLRSAVETMQAREGEYQRQIEAANQTIEALQSEPVLQVGLARDDDYEDDDYEEHEYEEEHEYDDD